MAIFYQTSSRSSKVFSVYWNAQNTLRSPEADSILRAPEAPRNTDLNSHVLGLQFKRTLEDPLPHNKEDHISLFYLPSRSSEKFRLLPDLKHSAFHVSFTLERVAFATLSFSICDLPQILLCVSFRGMFPIWVTEIGFKLAFINRPDSQENADHSIYNLSLAASCTKCIIICCI